MRYIEVTIQLPQEAMDGSVNHIPSIASFKSDAIVSYFKNNQYTMVSVVGVMEPFIVNMDYSKFKELLRG
jgi:hypothetical protein|tara:strand:- start:379 stop:588 length:210 start_codon:yes stop_codon:yes gene_type:complete